MNLLKIKALLVKSILQNEEVHINDDDKIESMKELCYIVFVDLLQQGCKMLRENNKD